MSISNIKPTGNDNGGNSPIQTIVDGALGRLQGKVLNIETEEILVDEKPDRDHNLRIKISFPSGESEKASLFALNLNGVPKSEGDAIEELTNKIERHLENREKPDAVKLSSGAMVFCRPGASIEEVNGYLTIDGKIAVLPSENQFMPLPGAMIQSYTHFIAFAEDDLVIMTDEHETVRDDGKEGMIVNLSSPLTLTRDQLNPHPKDENIAHLPETGEYLILYRKRDEAKTTS